MREPATAGVAQSQTLNSDRLDLRHPILLHNFAKPEPIKENESEHKRFKRGRRKRAKMPPQSELTKEERKAIVEQQLFESMISRAEGMSATAFNSLDQLDQAALRRWYKHAKRFVVPKD